ncbi:MAG: hypothetical protein IT443_11880 [Phycisphaeraceae bacterium]|nr:hypothetical protein [Phycisphaeraceae bacterium]
MPEPTLALTFGDMILRVAEFLGVASYGAAGDGAAAMPSDAHDLDLCKRLVNDGWRRFVNSNPRWHWLSPVVTITFDPTGLSSDTVNDGAADIPRAARYYMPMGFYGQMIGDLTYGQAGPRCRIAPVPEITIREGYSAAGSTTGDPFLVAFRPLGDSLGQPGVQRAKWEAIFYPAPSAVYTVSGRARIYPAAMRDPADRHAAGAFYDEAVLAAAMAVAEMQRINQSGPKEQAYIDALTRAMAVDQQTRPRNLGYCGDSSDGPSRPRRIYTGVDTYEGVPL